MVDEYGLIRWEQEGWGAHMWAILEGTMSRSSPTRAFPVARILFSPFGVNGMSEVPVWRPLSDHSVSPWRMIKARGVVIAEWWGRSEGEELGRRL